MPTQETEKLSKTALIIAHISEHGPKTEYDLYRELPGVSHGTIHYVLKNLTEQGALNIIPSRKGEKRPKKLYNLNFIGTVTNLAAYFPRPEIGVAEGEEAEYWANFEEEIQPQIIEFLEKQGQLQKYVPFQEIRWLCEHFPGIVKGFIIIATTICNHPPFPLKKPLAYLYRTTEKEEAKEKQDLICRTETAYREEFTDLFFQLLYLMRAKKRTNNYKLRRLAEEHLEEKIHETYEIKHAIRLLGKQNLTPEKSKSKN
jgi:DNA-binding PadR family transcriptional regulator